MAVLADKEIISLCTKPTHLVYDESGTPTEFIGPPYTFEQKLLIRNWSNENGRYIYVGQPYAVPVDAISGKVREEVDSWKPVIDNFEPAPVRYVHKETGEGRTIVTEEELDQFKKVISYGVTSYGYDVRLSDRADQLKIFTNLHSSEIDPKNITEENFAEPIIRTDSQGSKYVLIPPYSYLQGPTVEYFRIPRDVLVIVLGKSTYARSAVICNTTPIEPEFEGNVVIEVANLSSSPVRCYLNEGIAQFCFIKGNEECRTSYKDKAGKYQGQTGLTYAKV